MCTMRYSYEYLKTIYTGSNIIHFFTGDRSRSDKIKLECKVHGIFEQAISSVLSGAGCRKCYFDSKKGQLKYTTAEWVSRALAVHKGYYTYDRSVFTGSEKLITITCPVHGDFKQGAIVHLSGHGCKKCATERMIYNRSYNTEKFIEVSKHKHNGKYSYEKSVFTGIRNKVTITCPDHGDFEQVAYYHTHGNGCPVCGVEHTTYKSAPEYEIIDFIKSLGVTNVKQGVRPLGFELDIFLPDYNIAIEYNGLYWHSSNNTDDDKGMSVYHLNKTEQCERNGIKLFHVFENEWLDSTKKEIWKSMFKHSLKMSTRIFARKCCIKPISNTDSKEFCNNNHLQGGINSSHSYGLFHDNQLMSVLTIGKARYNNSGIEILRYCNKVGTVTVGGFSKLISYVSALHNTDLISYANRRWSSGNLYRQTGFKLTRISGPCYFYLDKKFNVYHRSTFTKKNVLKKFPNSSGTEVSIMYNNGYRRIWDCGNFVFTYSVKSGKKTT